MGASHVKSSLAAFLGPVGPADPVTMDPPLPSSVPASCLLQPTNPRMLASAIAEILSFDCAMKLPCWILKITHDVNSS